MKRTLLFSLLLFSASLFAQQQYTVNGQTYTLKTDVEGELTLLWNVIEDEFRYFSKKDTEIIELKNTELNGEYQEEYKEVLKEQTADATISVENVKLTLSSLRKFFNSYNKMVDPNFVVQKETVEIGLRLGAFAGISNNVYYTNPDNTVLPAAGAEFEIFDQAKLKRHAIVFRFTQLFANSEYDFSSSELSLNYRFKFVHSEAFNLFANLKVANYTYFSREINTSATNDVATRESISESGFDSPVSFGIGADIKLGNGYLFVTYNDFVSITNENVNEEFPMDFSVGYKFNL